MRSLTHCLLLALLSLGCQPGDSGPTATTQEGALGQVLPPSLDIETEQRLKTAEMRVTPHLHPGRLDVRLPDRAELLQSAILTSGPGWYAASMTADQHNVFVMGSRVAYRFDAIPQPEDQQSAASAPTLSRSDGIARLSFVDGGTAYTISVECEAPEADPRCLDDDYVVGLAGDMGAEVGP